MAVLEPAPTDAEVDYTLFSIKQAKVPLWQYLEIRYKQLTTQKKQVPLQFHFQFKKN